MVRVSVNSPEDLGSIAGRVLDSKMVFDATLLNTQHYQVRIKSKMELSRGRCGDLPYMLV